MFKTNISIIKPSSDVFPEELRALPQPPKQLFVAGQKLGEISGKPTVGIVGSRKVSPYGRSVTYDLAAALSRKGVVIVSGLALGVDSVAHRACLDANGQTIAVLPSGINSIYPAGHQGLAEQIINRGGTLVSEYPDKERPMKHCFIARNRIIAALSDILLVTEAAEKSGSLHTAQFALEQGKSVYAVPGPINSPTSVGTNNLIKMGANLALNPEDVLEELGLKSRENIATYIPENDIEKILIDLIISGVTDGDKLLIKSRLEAPIFQQHLTLLEIKGAISPQGNNSWQLK